MCGGAWNAISEPRVGSSRGRREVTEQAWTQRSEDAGVALIRWQLDARLSKLGNQPWSVPGCSELHFSADGRVSAHLDYWDAAGQLYEIIPLLGRCLRALRHRLQVDT